MGQNILVVNAEGPETRVAVVEEGSLAELFVERKHDRGLVGNIYRGKVTRVLPGMQAAFVDLGKGVERAAFLYVGDVLGADDGKKMFDDVETEDGDEAPEAAASRIARSRKHLAQRKIEDLLKPGHEVLVQVVKDPMGLKGARVTGYLSLPGRYSVYMPAVNQVGVSRRISSDKERKRLREVIIDARGNNKGGFILRTAADGTAEQEIRDDIEYLLRLWKEIGRREESVKGPGLIYGELDLSLRLVRDLVREETTEVHIDDEDQYNRVRRFTETFLPRYAERMKRFEGRRPIFDHFNIEPALRVAVARRVPLRSGGSLVIDQGEALTAIDVNTGSFTGSNNDLEETVTRNNLEACEEVARQLRLRNIGGIIVVDFIDMDKEGNRKKVWDSFQKALSKDRARCNVTKISELGLVEMTRKRTRESLSQLLTEACPTCEGAAVVKSTTTVAYEILREVRRSGSTVDAEKVEIECAPKVAEILSARERDYLDGLEKKFQKLVVVVPQKSWKPDQYRVAGKMSTEIAAEEAKQAAALGHAPPPVRTPGGGGGAGGKRRRRGGRGRSRD